MYHGVSRVTHAANEHRAARRIQPEVGNSDK